jgi:hypothetical protein
MEKVNDEPLLVASSCFDVEDLRVRSLFLALGKVKGGISRFSWNAKEVRVVDAEARSSLHLGSQQ